MTEPLRNGEPAVKFTLRELLARIDKQLAEIKEGLDTKASILVVNALRSDHDALASAFADLRSQFQAKSAGERTVMQVLRVVAGFAGWLIATGLAIYAITRRGQ